MIIDVSVTASSFVVRDMDKAHTQLKRASAMGLVASEISTEKLVHLHQAAETIERLFLWEEDDLVEEGELVLFLCKRLDWLNALHDFIDSISYNTTDQARETVRTIERFVDGLLVTEDDLDEAEYFCYCLSEMIWEHFISWHMIESDA